MRKLLLMFPVAAALITTDALTPQPAFAAPTCEQEISIRCHGYSVQGRPRLDIYYDSYEECVAAETPIQCGTARSLTGLSGSARGAIDERWHAKVVEA